MKRRDFLRAHDGPHAPAGTWDGGALRFFKWDRTTQAVDAIDTLEPFHTAELKRPG